MMFINEKKTKIASFDYEHNDGDQCWTNVTNFYKKEDGTYVKEYEDGYYGDNSIRNTTYEEIVSTMKKVKEEVEKQNALIERHGRSSVYARGGYTIYLDLETEQKLQKSDDAMKNITNSPNEIFPKVSPALKGLEDFFNNSLESLANENDIRYLSEQMVEKIKQLTEMAILKNKVKALEKENKELQHQINGMELDKNDKIEDDKPISQLEVIRRIKQANAHGFKEIWENAFETLSPSSIHCSKKINSETLKQGIEFRIVAPNCKTGFPQELSDWAKDNNCNIQIISELDRNTDMDFYNLYDTNRGWNYWIIDIGYDNEKEENDIENDEIELD